MTPKAFSICVPPVDVDDLARRLRTRRLPDDLANADWGYGVEREYLRELVDDWAYRYDWRAQEAAMNAYEHYRVDLSGQPTHYLHVGQGRGVPLLLIGGWPQTFWDFSAVLPLLDTFELVVPDLPGQAFSTPLVRPGLGFVEASEMLHVLMTEVLGHPRYGVYGTDWGALIGEYLAVTYPEAVLGLHTTMPVPLDFAPANREREDLWRPDERTRREAAHAQASTGSGYLHMQVHRPQTVGYLSDSPTATAAWLVDKIHSWTDHGGRLEDAYPRTALLTTLSIFWFTDSLGSAARFYAESFRRPWVAPDDRRPMVTVPTAVAAYPQESGAYPRRWVESYVNLHRYTTMDRGGHFPAVEAPQTLARDIAAFFTELSDVGGAAEHSEHSLGVDVTSSTSLTGTAADGDRPQVDKPAYRGNS